MYSRVIRFAFAVVLLISAAVPALAQERPAYPWTMPENQVAQFTSLTYQSGAITLTFGEGMYGPIVIQPDAAGPPQITGLEILADGRAKVQRGEEVLWEDDIHGAMLRFHPDDYPQFVKVEGDQQLLNAGLREMLLHLCAGSFARFWHRGMQAFIPDQGAAAAFVYSAKHGGVMLWQTATELKGFSMTTRADLFSR